MKAGLKPKVIFPNFLGYPYYLFTEEAFYLFSVLPWSIAGVAYVVQREVITWGLQRKTKDKYNSEPLPWPVIIQITRNSPLPVYNLKLKYVITLTYIICKLCFMILQALCKSLRRI